MVDYDSTTLYFKTPSSQRVSIEALSEGFKSTFVWLFDMIIRIVETKVATVGQAWQEKYQRTQQSSDFNWRKNQGKGYDDLLVKLSQMTQSHCSFCDAYPMGRIPKTIEHFKPKTTFPLLAYQWENLFLCCGNCQ